MQGKVYLKAIVWIFGISIPAGVAFSFFLPQLPSQVEIFHVIENYPARSGALTINITGEVTPVKAGRKLHYRLNDDAWQPISQAAPRTPPPSFTIEIDPQQLKPGENCLYFDAGKTISTQPDNRVCFSYQAQPRIPDASIEVDLRNQPLDVQDGRWEVVDHAGELSVRPVSGYEEYDRILSLTGAFPGGRRVEATMLFEGRMKNGKPYGFGVLPLWGGHQDKNGHFPRRGWAYGLAWYYSAAKGVGAEIAGKYADEPFQQINTYRSYTISPGESYQLITEAVPSHSKEGDYLGYKIRMKWWKSDESEPDHWMQVDHLTNKYLPNQNYAVALLAHRSQASFSSVKITPITEY